MLSARRGGGEIGNELCIKKGVRGVKKAGFGLIAGATALSVLLTGCAGLLERDYVHVTPHSTAPTAEGDPSLLRAESYQQLVNGLLYFVTLGAETGTIQLYLDAGDAEAQLEAACLEVVQEDPLGAYAVEFIKYHLTPVVSHYEAALDITYRRTRDQVASIVSATGVSAVRSELEAALSAFASERVLRIGYFEGDEDTVRALVRSAYDAVPGAALDLPEATVSLYPQTGRQRIVEIQLTYHLELTELTRRKEQLAQTARTLSQPLQGEDALRSVLQAARAVLSAGGYLPQGGNTAYDALRSGGANSEGLSLALALLCQNLSVPAQVVRGSRNGSELFWVLAQTDHGWRHLDLTQGAETLLLHTDREMADTGYTWDTAAYPQAQ